MLHSVVRAIMPAFGLASNDRSPESIDDAARSVYMFTKTFNYLLLVSKLKKDKRNEVSVMKLTMGQCIRRLIANGLVEATEDAKLFVERWKEISSESSKLLKLDMFDIYMLIMGAWKANRFTLVPYLYNIARKEWNSSKDSRFRQVSAIVLSFYVREHGQKLRISTVREILDDLNQRSISLSPTHFSMLILYFGATKSVHEMQRVLNKALEDPETRNSEALYYNTFRAFALTFTPQYSHGRSSYSQQDIHGDAGLSESIGSQNSFEEGLGDKDGLNYIDDLDTAMDLYRYKGDYSRSESGRAYLDGTRSISGPKHTAEQIQAAKVCTSLFQAMINNGVKVTLRAYRELIHCMIQLNMRDKAHKIFMFAIENLEPTEVSAHFISLYMRNITYTTRHMQYALRWYIQENTTIFFILKQFTRKELVDHFGIFNGDLNAFVQKAKRAAKDPSVSDNGAFLRRFIFNMRSATKAAQFMNCALAGHDPGGEFVGYNFAKLRRDGSGLENIEREVLDICQHIHGAKGKSKWLSNKSIIHNLLPVLSEIDLLPKDTPDAIRSIKELVDECASVGQFVARLESAGVENWDISLVDQFLRIKYLGLTFRLYAQRRAAVAIDSRTSAGVFSNGSGSNKSGYWPSFMYEMSHNPTVHSGDLFLITEHGGGLREHSKHVSRISNLVPAAEESWGILVDAFRRDPGSRLSPRLNTVGIFSLMAIWTSSWSLGQRVWNDVFQLMGSKAAAASASTSKARVEVVSAPLQQLRIYKHYLQFLRAATLAGAAKHRDRDTDTDSHLAFGDAAITEMFMAMDSNGVEVSSGLMCQGIRAALEVGQLDVSRVLEQWQAHREQTGAAQEGFMNQWFSCQALPVIPEQTSSVMELVRGDNECPQLSRYIEERTLRGRAKK
ncbi:hypothetical protein EV178_000127 [Coemansia sp. RSA 1646]|nr:hypothetical protein EV178_000127 [Coemansia sp. RSA 1646]KAJ2217560.1 hypothetical protein EV179_000395 [Coemansia sp. RSA 487]